MRNLLKVIPSLFNRLVEHVVSLFFSMHWLVFLVWRYLKLPNHVWSLTIWNCTPHASVCCFMPTIWSFIRVLFLFNVWIVYLKFIKDSTAFYFWVLMWFSFWPFSGLLNLSVTGKEAFVVCWHWSYIMVPSFPTIFCSEFRHCGFFLFSFRLTFIVFPSNIYKT